MGRPRGPVSSSIAVVQGLTGQPLRQQTPSIHHHSNQHHHHQTNTNTMPTTIFKCAKCSALFKNQKDLIGHSCFNSDPVTIKNETTIGTIGGLSLEEAKVLELAAKAATSVSPSSTRQTIQTTSSRQGSTRQKTSTRISSSNRNQQTTGIGARGKQAQQPVIDLQAIAQAQGISDEATGTQVIHLFLVSFTLSSFFCLFYFHLLNSLAFVFLFFKKY